MEQAGPASPHKGGRTSTHRGTSRTGISWHVINQRELKMMFDATATEQLVRTLQVYYFITL